MELAGKSCQTPLIILGILWIDHTYVVDHLLCPQVSQKIEKTRYHQLRCVGPFHGLMQIPQMTSFQLLFKRKTQFSEHLSPYRFIRKTIKSQFLLYEGNLEVLAGY